MYREIGRVQAYLHNLIKRGDDTPSLAIDDSKQAKPAAIERVPPEILSMIFEQAVPPQTDDEDPRIVSVFPRRSPNKLARLRRRHNSPLV
ncbi:hypothetical protein FIBSPDRAFT_855598 [Athelia psychrophila]|uniref:Uncharacterized protein n=1 Tax=Athelia psychrophila TaxID=1759441 RepID=A0A166P2W9_9AGAM|nr:hypothetical protein FIBSPDRAFT_855598 [Fibularhizoctonia sp. CBS 109695]